MPTRARAREREREPAAAFLADTDANADALVYAVDADERPRATLDLYARELVQEDVVVLYGAEPVVCHRNARAKPVGYAIVGDGGVTGSLYIDACEHVLESVL